MKKQIKIHPKYQTHKLPIFQFITTYLLLEKFNAPEYAYGIAITFFSLVAVTVVMEWIMDDHKAPNQIGEE